jgi:enolase
LISSSPERLKKAAKCINAVIVKPNQIGTISDCLELMSLARSSGISPAVSHRSTETCCTSTAKLALQADFAKFGVAGIHSEKRNELIRLWDAAKKPEMRKI